MNTAEVLRTVGHADEALGHTLGRLRELGEAIARPGGGTLTVDDGARVVGYAGRARERIARVSVGTPWLVFVLEGHKRAVMGTSHVVHAGEALMLPAGVRLDVTNVPSPATGVYRALCVELLGDAQALLRRHHPDMIREATWLFERPRAVRVGLSTLQALVHVCETVLDPAAHPRLLHHRIAGLLLALAVEQEPRAASCAQAEVDVVRAVQNLVRSSPESALRAGDVARQLGLSAATLRRRLTARGTGLRAILRDERMALGRVLLTDRRLALGEVAQRCGYASVAKFSRQFRRQFGCAPRAPQG